MRPLYTTVVVGIEKLRSRSSLFAKRSGASNSYDLPNSGAYNNLEQFHDGRYKSSGGRTQISAARANDSLQSPDRGGLAVLSMDDRPLVERSVRWETSTPEHSGSETGQNA